MGIIGGLFAYFIENMKLVLLSLLLVGVSAIELTADNWDAETAGKSAFIKFQAPW